MLHSPGISVRFATEKDLEQVCRINIECFGAHKRPGAPELELSLAKNWMHTYVEETGAHRMVVALDGEEVVGYVIWQTTNGIRVGSAEKPLVVQLFQIGVSPEYQSNGVGRALVEKSLETYVWQWIDCYAPDTAIAHVYVVFSAGNVRVIPFYERYFPINRTEHPIERMPGAPEYMRSGWLTRTSTILTSSL